MFMAFVPRVDRAAMTRSLQKITVFCFFLGGGIVESVTCQAQRNGTRELSRLLGWPIVHEQTYAVVRVIIAVSSCLVSVEGSLLLIHAANPVFDVILLIYWPLRFCACM